MRTTPAGESDGAELPDRLFLRIGEVSRLTGVEPHVLRYWETEFRSLRPKKSRSGQRLYRRGDVELVLRIKDLLWSKRFTVAGAVAEVERPRKQVPQKAPEPTWDPPRVTGDRPTDSHSVDLPDLGPALVERPRIVPDEPLEEGGAVSERLRVQVEEPAPPKDLPGTAGSLAVDAQVPEELDDLDPNAFPVGGQAGIPVPQPMMPADAVRRLSAPALPTQSRSLPRSTITAVAVQAVPSPLTQLLPDAYPLGPPLRVTATLRALRTELAALRTRVASARSS